MPQRVRRPTFEPDVATREGPALPTTFEELAQTLQRQLGDFSAAHARVARQILSDPEGCAFMTVSELAAAARVDQSTVVRFAVRIGLSGYPALARLCREHLRDQAQTVGRFERLRKLASQGAGTTGVSRLAKGVAIPLDAVAATDQGNIVRTFARISPADWSRAVNACADSKAVYVVGLRKCFSVAHLFTYLLGMIRDDVHQVTGQAGLFPDSLRRLGPKDACVGITIHRYTKQTVQALQFARRRGAFTISLTDNAASPVVAYSDVTLYVDTSSLSVLRSLTAFTSLSQALVAAVAVRRGTETRSALLVEEDVLSEFDVYATEPDTVSGDWR
jgi:DNA-binding MurR/RpiR family transcriptional regulator